MSVYRRGEVWWYSFNFAGAHYQESTKSKSKTLAKDAEKMRRRGLEETFNGTADNRKTRVQSIGTVASAYLNDYKVRHRAVKFAPHAVGHVRRLLGDKMVAEISERTVKGYQTA